MELAGIVSLAPLPTAAERAAEVIRQQIFEGRFAPGTAIPEASLAAALQVSRNTVREAYRTLVGEHLLVYTAHKGVRVRRLGVADVRDIYTARGALELSAIELLHDRPALDATAFRGELDAGDRAATAGDWAGAGTANLRFHSRIAALHGSTRVDEFFRRLMTELRLGFLALPDPRAFHEPYLRRNHEIAGLVTAGRLAEAGTALRAYLDESAAEVAAAVGTG